MRNLKTTVILVRHGQTEWNRVERFRGRADVPLNDTGLKQAEATGRHVTTFWQPVAIYSSPLSRGVMTAEAIGKYANLSVEIHPGLVDIDYGDWQGLTPNQVHTRWPEIVNAWYKTPHLALIPHGETLDELRQRVMTALLDLTSRHPDKTIVLVGHTVINRVILLGILGLGNDRIWHIQQEPCAINVFKTEGDDYTLVSMNETSHLRSLEGNSFEVQTTRI